jgi:hypothetical protein
VSGGDCRYLEGKQQAVRQHWRGGRRRWQQCAEAVVVSSVEAQPQRCTSASLELLSWSEERRRLEDGGRHLGWSVT